MGLFGFGKPKEPPVPVGQGVGPDFTAPDPLIPGPYIASGGGYAPTQEPIAAQWALNNHHNSPPPGAPQDWGKYHNSQTESYGEEVSSTATVSSSVSEQTRAPDPRWNPPAVDRPTRAPSAYRFLRAFDQWAARQLNGSHFSMASNERTYPIGGMTPAKERGRRNTYRLTPEPWDENIVDRTPEVTPVNGTYIVDDQVASGTRSWRL